MEGWSWERLVDVAFSLICIRRLQQTYPLIVCWSVPLSQPIGLFSMVFDFVTIPSHFTSHPNHFFSPFLTPVSLFFTFTPFSLLGMHTHMNIHSISIPNAQCISILFYRDFGQFANKKKNILIILVQWYTKVG